MSIALKLEKTVSAVPEAPRTRAFTLGLVARAHALRDTLISLGPDDVWQVLLQLQHSVLFEWACREKTVHDLDFLGLGGTASSKLSSRRTAAGHEPNVLFNVRALPSVFYYFAGDFFGGQSGGPRPALISRPPR